MQKDLGVVDLNGLGFIFTTPKVCGCYMFHFSCCPFSTELDLHNKTHVCTCKFTMKHMRKPDWKSDLPLFSYGNRKCMFVDFLIGNIGPPNCVHC